MGVSSTTKWTIGYWIDQMRKQNAPDLPEGVEVEEFQDQSERMAKCLERAYDLRRIVTEPDGTTSGRMSG